MNKAERQKIKKKLLARKKELLSLVQVPASGNLRTKDVNDIADDAFDSYEQELGFQLTNHERAMLSDINDALQKVDANTYGICEHCGKKISKARLRAVPFARLCIKCKKKLSS